ncbi:MAG: hypothetical protein FJY20_05455 [Bacteroidetes bacterium]|nr:hypothetical protein [Bacteroidota bacterium]
MVLAAQDNSPNSRYGIGDLAPSTNINTRAMGGISAGYIDYRTINFANPASYSFFEANPEARSRKLANGRAVLDIGINLESRTLRETNPARKFTAGNLLFSYVQVSVPVKKNWGISFGLRPVSRVSYKIFSAERLKDPLTGLPIDSVTTLYDGDGGSSLATAGTGFKIFKKTSSNKLEESLSVGFNAGYYFGKRNSSSRREFRNDTVQYFSGNFETKTNYNNIYLAGGLLYVKPLKKENMFFSAGVYGSLKQTLNATQDRIRETFVYDLTLGDLRLDSVSDIKDIKGKVVMPASITAGFLVQQYPDYAKRKGGWLVGIDFAYQNWEKYRVYGQADSLRNKWEVRIGAQVNPVPGQNYFKNVEYRWGFFFGPDYVNIRQKLPQFGVSMGLGLPLKYVRNAPNQTTVINLAFEYIKRGNNDNLLKENLFRLSAGFSLSDIWFIKRKYD